MEFEILGPTFKCQEDENVFFSRIYSLPGYDNVVGQGRYLYLTVKNQPDRLVVNQVQEICEFWNTEFTLLD